MFELSLNGVKKYMDATLILEDITFQVYAGEKVGIVGQMEAVRVLFLN